MLREDGKDERAYMSKNSIAKVNPNYGSTTTTIKEGQSEKRKNTGKV